MKASSIKPNTRLSASAACERLLCAAAAAAAASAAAAEQIFVPRDARISDETLKPTETEQKVSLIFSFYTVSQKQGPFSLLITYPNYNQF